MEESNEINPTPKDKAYIVTDIVNFAVPEDRVTKNEYDIPLQEGEFLFNGGHSYGIAPGGVVMSDKIYKIEGDTHNWAVVNLTSNTDTNNQKQTELLVQYIGEQFRQGGLDADDSNVEYFQEQLANPTINSQTKENMKKFIERKQGEKAKKIMQLKISSKSAKEYMARVPSNIENYETTMADVTRIEAEIASHGE